MKKEDMPQARSRRLIPATSFVCLFHGDKGMTIKTGTTVFKDLERPFTDSPPPMIQDNERQSR
jgi:hypothetical protein